MAEPEDPADIALEVRNLSRSYGAHRAVADLDLTVRRGDIYGFLGPNGAGKTTAMRCMLGIIRRDTGTVRIFGDDHLTRARSSLGAIIEIPAFHGWTSARLNLRWACAYAGLPRSTWATEIDKVIERVGLKGRENDRVRTYSLGMKQRLGIGRALLGGPQLLLLDEPTNGLDPKGMREVRDLIKSLAIHDKITIFVSSHLLAEVQAMATRVGIIQSGQLRAEGTLKDLLEQHETRRKVTVRSTDGAALRSALERVEGITFEVAPDSAEAEVVCGSMTIAELNKALVSRDVPIEALVPMRSTLEDVFMEVTR
ncbi:MAG: ATP-binding cassette domain-containing protein [Myxococcota bacterium]